MIFLKTESSLCAIQGPTILCLKMKIRKTVSIRTYTLYENMEMCLVRH